MNSDTQKYEADFIYERSEIPTSLIDECNSLSDETGDVYFIFDTNISNIIRSKSVDKSEILDLKIDSIINDESRYHIGTSIDFDSMPSRFTYYDTETRESNRYKRYNIVLNFIKNFDFNSSELNLGPEYEQSFTYYNDEEYILLILRIKPNLIIEIKDGYENKVLYSGIFSRSLISECLVKCLPKVLSRDIKIKSIINGNTV